MIDGKKIRPTKCVPSALALFILLSLPSCFGVVNIYFQGQFILDPAGHFISETFYTMGSLIAHGSIYQGNTDEKTSLHSSPASSFLSVSASHSQSGLT